MVLTYTVTTVDSQGATGTHEIIVTVDGTNDIPVFGNQSGDSLQDSLAVTGAALTTQGYASVEDLDRSELVSVVITGFSKTGDIVGLARSDAELQAMFSVDPLVVAGGVTSGAVEWFFDSDDYSFSYL